MSLDVDCPRGCTGGKDLLWYCKATSGPEIDEVSVKNFDTGETTVVPHADTYFYMCNNLGTGGHTQCWKQREIPLDGYPSEIVVSLNDPTASGNCSYTGPVPEDPVPEDPYVPPAPVPPPNELPWGHGRQGPGGSGCPETLANVKGFYKPGLLEQDYSSWAATTWSLYNVEESADYPEWYYGTAETYTWDCKVNWDEQGTVIKQKCWPATSKYRDLKQMGGTMNDPTAAGWCGTTAPGRPHPVDPDRPTKPDWHLPELPDHDPNDPWRPITRPCVLPCVIKKHSTSSCALL